MKRIMIIGCGGAGKSTLAQELGEVLGIKVIHLDSLFWRPGWRPIEREEWESIQRKLIAESTWIIDGNYGSTMDLRLREADTIIFLDYSTIRCLFRVVKRRIMYHGKTRPDMGKECEEKIDLEFIKWILTYNKKQTPEILNKVKKLPDKRFIHLRNPKETERFVEVWRKK